MTPEICNFDHFWHRNYQKSQKLEIPADIARFRAIFWPKKWPPKCAISTIFDTKIAKNAKFPRFSNLQRVARAWYESKKSKIAKNGFNNPETIIVYDIGSIRPLSGALGRYTAPTAVLGIKWPEGWGLDWNLTYSTFYPKICKFDTKIVKNPEFQDFSSCRGWLGRDRNRKNPKSPKMGKTTQELS